MQCLCTSGSAQRCCSPYSNSGWASPTGGIRMPRLCYGIARSICALMCSIMSVEAYEATADAIRASFPAAAVQAHVQLSRSWHMTVHARCMNRTVRASDTSLLLLQFHPPHNDIHLLRSTSFSPSRLSWIPGKVRASPATATVNEATCFLSQTLDCDL
jgi:hypothetical protein